MTLPFGYQNASLQFDRFMVDARDAAGLTTTNMAWNMVVGVLLAFRRRLAPKEALRFADALPPVLRALFLENWNLDEPVIPFGTKDDWLVDVRAVRPAHNFSPPDAVKAVAWALRRQVDAEAFERVLASLPAGSREFWSESAT